MQRKWASVTVPMKKVYFPPYAIAADHYWPDKNQEQGQSRFAPAQRALLFSGTKTIPGEAMATPLTAYLTTILGIDRFPDTPRTSSGCSTSR